MKYGRAFALEKICSLLWFWIYVKKESLKENTPHIAVSLCFEGPISMAK